MATEKMDQDLAYYQLLKLAKEMHEGLQLARNQKDYAPKFQEQVGVTIGSLIARFSELQASLPDADGPRYVYDREGNHLKVYSPGDGGVKFTWLDDDNNATGKRVFYDDAQRALMLPRNFQFQGILVDTATGPELLPQVSRMGPYLLRMGETVYQYKLGSPFGSKPWVSAEFTLNASPFVPQNGKPVENGAVTQKLKKFLWHEDKDYTPTVIIGERLLDIGTGREATVTLVSEGSVSVSTHDDFTTMYPTQLFERYRVPRFEVELAEIVQAHNVEWENLQAKKPAATSSANSPAP